jgi:hypothetical protein
MKPLTLAVSIFAVIAFLLGTEDLSLAQVRVVTDSVLFDRDTGAAAIPIPASQKAFPAVPCGFGDRGPTGKGPSVQIPFGTNRVVISQAVTGSSSLCIFDGGTMILSALNTLPNFMTANPIIGNGEDDFLLVFDSPVKAVSLQLLTNRFAKERVTFKDQADATIGVVDIDHLTPRNERVFVGFISKTPFKSMLIETEGGAVQNEGFDALKVAETLAPAKKALP